ncbi:Tat pathway signal sequence domain protein, partial [Streptomyces albidoflavus]
TPSTRAGPPARRNTFRRGFTYVLHQDGVLTDEEFSLAKQAVLRRL